MATGNVINPDIDFIKDIKNSGGESLKKCFQCATCSVVCSHAPAENPFPRKEMIWTQWGQSRALVSDPDIWLCYQCNDCSVKCPRDARPSEVLGAVRSYVYKHFAFPSFMGRAVSKPAALPALILFPMIVMLVMAMAFVGSDFNIPNTEIKFASLIPTLWLEVLFIGGNVMIFAFAFIGLRRFWEALQQGTGEVKNMSFISAVTVTVKDIISHANFKNCQANKARYLAHMLVFFGFIGAMITAGLAVASLVLFGMESPIPLSNPIKWLGNISGDAGFIGLTIIIVMRLMDKDKTGRGNYSDWLFIVTLYIVFITGMSAQFARLAQSATVAFSIYYFHLVTVFFLLWYAPYSKFGHMFYRSLALVHVRQLGRTAR